MESQNSRTFRTMAYHMARVGCSDTCEVGIQQLQFQCAIIALMTEKKILFPGSIIRVAILTLNAIPTLLPFLPLQVIWIIIAKHRLRKRKGIVDGAGTLSKVASLGGRERVTGGGGRAQTERTRAWRNHPSRSAPGWKTKTHRGGMLLGRSLLCQLQRGIRWRLRTSVLWAGCLTRCGKGSSRRTAIRTTRSPSRRPAGRCARAHPTTCHTPSRRGPR